MSDLLKKMQAATELNEATSTGVKKIDELEGEDVDVRFKTKGSFSKYFSSVSFTGKITKIDVAKKIFVVEYDRFRMNDETVAGGPGDKIKKYKTTFNFKDIDFIETISRNYFNILMKD